MTTKEKIISKATTLFNERGYAAVSLFEIAQQLKISRGNLTYHFKDKNALLIAISSEMWRKIEHERLKSRQLPSFENLHNEVQLYYKIQKEYAFIFLDAHVVNHHSIKKQFREMIDQTLQDNKAAIAFAIELGNLKPEPFPGTYNNISFITWMLTYYWLPQQIMRGEKTGEDGEKLIWSILMPHFTDKGIQSFKSFFGASFFNELGEPFETDITSLINF